jgi:hypothetical protein
MPKSASAHPSSQALQFAGFVLLHCGAIADDNRGGELICPFAVLWDNDGRRVVHFESETQEEAVQCGWSSLAASQERAEWWAFGREGLIRTEGQALDVLLVSVWTPEQDEPFTITQGFARANDASLYLVGPPDLLIGGRNGAESVSEWDREILLQGIRSHPQGAKWSSWLPQ